MALGLCSYIVSFIPLSPNRPRETADEKADETAEEMAPEILPETILDYTVPQRTR